MYCAGEPFQWVYKLLFNLLRYYLHMFYCNLYGILNVVFMTYIIIAMCVTLLLYACDFMLCIGLLKSLYEFQTGVDF